MKFKPNVSFSRRQLLSAGAAGLGVSLLPGAVRAAQPAPDKNSVERNVSGFSMANWQDYFDDPHNGMILCDLKSRAVHFWSADLTVYKLYPCSVPLNEELTRRGRTSVVQKIVSPPWRPTPSMRERNPDWPEVIEGGAWNNPLGSHALYLSWTYYRIHGTHDTRKIGRQSSHGCVGLYNEHVTELFDLVKVGTQVLLI